MEINIKRIKYINSEGILCINEKVSSTNLCDHLKDEKYHFGESIKTIESEKFCKNEIIPVLVFPRMECDIDYDYDECPYETYYEEYDEAEIRFCPVCGEEIKINVVEEIDITEDFKEKTKRYLELSNIRGKRSRKLTEELFSILDDFYEIMNIDKTKSNVIYI